MDDKNDSLTRRPFSSDDLKCGEDGEWYHVPTLRALRAAGRLAVNSAGYLLLLELTALETSARARMIA